MKRFLALSAFLLICAFSLGCGGSNQASTPPQNKDAKLISQEASITYEQAESILNVLQECGMKGVKNFKYDSTLDNILGEGVKGYRLSTENIKSSTVYLKEGKPFYIGSNIGGEIREMYKSNQILSKVSDYMITAEDEVQLKRMCEKGITAMLKSPKTAEFAEMSDWRYYKDKEKIVVQSYVDAQNGFGALIRSKFQITFTPDKSTVTSFIFDGKEYIK